MSELLSLGSAIDIPIKDLLPDRVLYDFDGPRIFSIQSTFGELLAFVLNDLDDCQWVLVSPTASSTIHDLQVGRLSIRDAMSQSWAWVASAAYDGAVIEWVKVPLSALQSMLPDPDVMLFSRLQPLLSVKLEGHEITKDNVRASVVKQAIEGGTTAIKRIVDYIAGAQSEGRPTNALRLLSDLPTQRLAFGSFEIDFGRPDVDPAVGQQVLENAALQQDLSRVGDELKRLLDWISSDNDPETDAPELQLLKALERLAPPIYGQVESVAISGTLFGYGSTPRRLTRENTRKLKKALKVYEREQALITIVGQIREIDKDKLQFTLRNIQAESELKEVSCRFPLELLDFAWEQAGDDSYVIVSGRQIKNFLEVSDLSVSARPVVSNNL